MKKLLITSEQLFHPQIRQTMRYQVCALYEDSRMIETELHRADTETILNHIYVARVKNVVVSLHAAFVEIAQGNVCYLPLEDLKHPLFTKKISKKTLVAGDELVVQVAKEAVKTKDPVVTTNLSFAGEYLVLTSSNCRIGISSKISGQERVRLHAFAQTLLREHACETEGFGLIFRTNAANAPEEDIREEFARLWSEYQTLCAHAAARTAYSCLRKEPPFYLKMLTDTDKTELEEVVTDDRMVFEEIKQSVSGHFSVRFYEDRLLPLPRLYNVAGQIEAALKPRVWLKSGANLVIEPTEALTVVDVNSGKNIAKKDKALNLYKINLEAAKELAFQLRLRNLSGIIVTDFIDMQEEEWKQKLMEQLRVYLRQDPVPATLVDMTKLGLIEITRKKKKKPLAEQLCV